MKNETSKSLPLCVDANIVIRLVGYPDAIEVQQLWEGWVRAGEVLIAPTLLMFETSNALHQMQRAGSIAALAADAALQAALALPLELISDDLMFERAFDIARRLRLSASYDAHYIALAERESAPLWTADKRLYNSVHQHLDWVHLLEPGVSSH